MGPFASLALFVPLWGPQAVLQGLDTKGRKWRPVSYTIADGMILVAILAIAASLVSNIRQRATEGQFSFILGMANLFGALMWFKCLKFMATHGIAGSWQRTVMQLFVYPSSVLTVGYLGSSTLMLSSNLISAANHPSSETSPYLLIPMAVTFAVAIGWICLTRSVYRKILESESLAAD